MARIAMDDFLEGQEIVRVYLAAALEEARRVEEVLDRAGISFGVEVETYTRTSFLVGGSARSGAGFWVDLSAADEAIDALEAAGLLRGLAERDGR
ncbi:MAG TPA: hypothetical protein VLS93_03915 [Anaeromyxobacteraceae bacterium]|nr:hypothetical protein [Anaeromyxobacteraceae bacterium]